MYNVLNVIVSYCRRISMQKQLYKRPYGDFVLIHDDKFHDYILNYRILFPLNKKTNTTANLLCKMMGNQTLNSPSKKAMRERKNMLYGVKTASQTYALGEMQVIDLQLRAIAQRFVSQSIVDQQISLLQEMFFMPLLNEATLKEAKEKLKRQHARLFDQNQDKALLDAFVKGTETGYLNLSSLGQEEIIDAITLEEVKSFHQMLVANAYKSLIASGSVTLTDAQIEKFNQGQSQKITNPFFQSEVKKGYDEAFHEGDQTELIMLFDPKIKQNDFSAVAYMVYVSYLGQLPNSLLFQVVREKHSLCYSIFANRLIFDGIMTIQTSINDKNLEKTIAIIQECITQTKSEIHDLESVKKKLITSLSGALENKNSLNIRAFYNLVKQTDETIEDLQEKIAAVTEADLMAIANMLPEPYIYAYRGGAR